MEYIPVNNEFNTSTVQRESQTFFDYTGTWEWKSSILIESGIKNLLNLTDEKYGPFIGRTYYIKFTYIVN